MFVQQTNFISLWVKTPNSFSLPHLISCHWGGRSYLSPVLKHRHQKQSKISFTFIKNKITLNNKI